MPIDTINFALYSTYVMALRFVPRELTIPKNYWISTYANHALPTNRQIIESTPMKPTGLTNVTWPVRKVFGELFRLFNYAVDEPLIALTYHVEKTIRGNFNLDVNPAEQAVQLSEESSAAFYKTQYINPPEKQNVIVYQTQIELNQPKSNEESMEATAEELIEAMQLSFNLILELQTKIKQLQEPIKALKQHVEDITKTRKLISSLETAREVQEKITSQVWMSEEKPFSSPFKWDSTNEVTSYFWTSKKILSSHEITRVQGTPLSSKLKIYDERITKVKAKLREAIQILTKTQLEYEQMVETFTYLMNKYEKLGFEQTDKFQEFKKNAELLQLEKL